MLTCMDCPEPYGSRRFPDMLIPNWAWNLIVPERGGVLCPNCIIGRLDDAGLEHVPCRFVSGPTNEGDGSEPAWVWKDRIFALERKVEQLHELTERDTT